MSPPGRQFTEQQIAEHEGIHALEGSEIGDSPTYQ
jgi:hypothetical protein